MTTTRAAIAAVMFVSAAAAQPPAGLWDATVTVNNVAIPFRMELSGEGGAVRASFFNGDEKVPSSSGKFENGGLLLWFDQYAAKLEAAWKDGVLDGQYTRGTNRPYPFHATPAFSTTAQPADAPNIAGQWEIATKSSKGESAWRFVVRQNGSAVSAAILRVDGDTGALEGSWHDGKFVLSHFDGARPLLLEVTPASDGTLELLQNGRQKLTAVRAAEARAKGLPAPTDASAHTGVKDPSQPFHFSFPDLSGKIVSDTDERFRGKVVIVAIGGSWCPNCHDEAPFLVELYRKYHPRGLEVVGLFFEETDQLKDPSRVRAFIKHYGIPYPMLLAGETSELQAKLPQAVNLDCWPTTFYLGRDGRVSSVHAGFAAAASGSFHEELTGEVTRLIERLLDETTMASAH